MTSISILGCGWLGLSLGSHLVDQGFVVKGSTTRAEKLPLLAEKGIQAFLIKVGSEGLEGPDVEAFFKSEILLLNIPPRRREANVAQRFPREVKMITAAALRAGLQKILLVSSTAVYPSKMGWVKESDATEPETESGKGLVAAEQFLEAQKDCSVTILRLAGLIGGARHPGRWFAGKKNLGGGKVPINLVHRDDCIAAIEAIIVQEKWGERYQLCADEHPLKGDFYPAMAKQLGLEIPEFTGTPILPYKIVGNEKIKKDLGLVLKYPDPRKITLE